MIRAVRGVLLIALAAVLACVGTPAPSSPKAVEQACRDGDAEACERAVVDADVKAVPSLIEALSAASGDDAWRTLFARLKAEPQRVAYLGPGPAPRGVAVIALELSTKKVPLAEVVHAVARAAGHQHLLLAEDKTVHHIFGSDVLDAHMFGLPAILAADRRALAAEIALERKLRASIEAARRFDYVKAAKHADELRALAAKRPANSETAMRARHGIALLAAAGVALEPTTPAPSIEAPAKLSSAYAHCLAVLLATDRPAAWKARRKHIAPRLSPARLAVIDAHNRPPGSCPPPVIPPIERVSDIGFAGWLSWTLDPNVAPGERAPEGKLGLADWLTRYERLVKLVTTSKSAWSAAPSLLAQRGELGGLTTEGTATYARVTELGLAHIEALDKLSAWQPARFSPIGVANLAYQPGVLEDPRLALAVRDLGAKSLDRSVQAAETVEDLFDTGLTGFAMGTSFPPQLRGPQLESLANAMSQKLAGPFGQKTGWRVAAMHLGDALLALARGEPPSLGKAAPRIAHALAAQDVTYPGFARLAAAAVEYAAVAQAGKLDASVSNPALYPPERARARDALREAIARLDDGGPRTPEARELLARVTELSDGVIAMLAAELSTAEKADAVSCPGRPSGALSDAQQRLTKRRRTLLDSAAFTRGDDPWLARARFVALVLSDALNRVILRQRTLTIAAPDAERIVQTALTGWTEPDVGELLGGGYLLTRTALGEEQTDKPRMIRHATTTIRGLAKVFDADQANSSLFQVIAQLSSEAMSVAASDVGEALAGHARRSYAAGDTNRGDLALLVALGAALVREEPVAEPAITVAKERARPVHVALLLYGKGAREGGDPAALGRAMRDATRQSCSAVESDAVIRVRQALYDFNSGRRPQALKALGEVLERAERRGLAVPRQIYNYQQHASGRAISLEQSFSFGAHLLKGSGSLQLGLGMVGGSDTGARLDIRLADPNSEAAREDAARYYAHVAALTAVYRYVENDRKGGLAAAQRAIASWANGVRLGRARVPVAGQTARWAEDATAVVAIAAQLAAERGETFLAGDLWTLARASMRANATDSDIAALLDPLPAPLRGIDELKPVAERAARSLETLADKLPCTDRRGRVQELERVSCDTYPLALSLRVADGLTRLPRLKPGAEAADPTCGAWRALDEFLAAAEQQRYEPDRFVAAIDVLRSTGRLNDAATLLSRQRHQSHCAPALLAHARALARHTELGVHTRADLLSLAANCDPRADITADLTMLDEITQEHALPARNFEVLVFAARLAVADDRWQPLYAIARNKNFVKRWLEVGPDVATAALLVVHAATLGAGEKLDLAATLPYYRTLCSSFPAKGRGAMCNALALLRGEGAVNDKKRAAREALGEFVQQAIASLRPPGQP